MLMMFIKQQYTNISAIDIGDFYGTGNVVTVAASAGTNVDVAPLFASPDTFTNTVSKILTIAAPIAINGNNVALTVPSNMAGTLDIQNAGTITGARGTGGNAGGAGGNGGAGGGAAISVQSNGVSITNSGNISGGGGGGGGGAGGANTSTSNTVNFGATSYTILTVNGIRILEMQVQVLHHNVFFLVQIYNYCW